MKTQLTADSIGTWIINHRPDEDILNYLLLPLLWAVFFNVGLIAIYFGNIGSAGHVISTIIFLALGLAIAGFYYEYFYDSNTFFLWDLFKYFLAVILSLIPFLLIFGNITGFIAATMLGIGNNEYSYPNAITTLSGIGLLITLTVLTLYSFFGFKSDNPKTVFNASLFVFIAFIINVLMFLIALGYGTISLGVAN